MAAPSVTLGTSYFQATSSSSHTVNLPAGTAYKGVWIVTLSGTSHTVSGPSGWTLKVTVASTTARKLSLLTSDATTSATSVQVDTTQTTIAAAVGFDTDGDLSAVVTPTGVTGSSTTPDPPASGTITSGDYRLIAVAGYWDARRTISGYPTNYSDNQVNVKGTLNNEAAFGLATRGMTGITSEDPGTFTLSATLPWATSTVAIPAAAGGAVTGTIAVTDENDTSAISGTHTPPPVSGTIAVTDANDTPAFSGTYTPPPITGTIAVTEAADTSAMSGTVSSTSYPGGLPTAAVIAIYDARELAGSATDPVSAWADTGPLSQDDLVQATSGNRPVLDDSGFGSVRSVKFDGSNDRMDMTLASTYSDDFAFILVCELLTYPSSTAGVFYSGDAIPNKNILGVDDVEDPPGWVVMSSNDGTQAQHHHGTANQTYLEATPSRFIMTQLVRNDGEHKLWENSSLVIDLADSSGENSDLNNLTKLKLGTREDNSRPVNGRIAYIILVDMTETDQATLLAARDELAPEFNIDLGFTGTIAVTEANDTSAISGTHTPPAVTGTIAVTDAADTAAMSGTHTPPGISGTIAITEANDTSAFSGTFTAAGFTGTIAVTEANDTPAMSGTVTLPAITGTIAVTEANDTGFFAESGVTLDITAFGLIQFHRHNGTLVYSPVGRSTKRGFATSEGFEAVSTIIRVDFQPDADASPDAAMETLVTAWAAHAGSPAATLRTAIHQALQTAGFRSSNGSDLT